jgi:hypothetical protein
MRQTIRIIISVQETEEIAKRRDNLLQSPVADWIVYIEAAIVHHAQAATILSIKSES